MLGAERAVLVCDVLESPPTFHSLDGRKFMEYVETLTALFSCLNNAENENF